jgi:hypothetical protein
MVDMGHPAEKEARLEQAKILRRLAERLEGGGESLLPTELEEALLRELEDRADVEAARAARDEERVPLEELKTRLGL